ncbi:MAG: hypothetical protein ACYC2H_12365 [Thermoplasmatota archaeon]
MNTASAFLAASAMVFVAVATSGCTLIHTNDPFRISVINHLATTWDGSVVVVDDEGNERFRRHLPVSARSISLTIDIPPLAGDFTFIVESGGGRWEGHATVAEGSYSWTVTIEESGAVCFQFLLDGAGQSDCPPRSQA